MRIWLVLIQLFAKISIFIDVNRWSWLWKFSREIFSSPVKTPHSQNNIKQMKNSNRPYRKFLPQQDKIEELEKSSSRFKRIYSEYELMSDELWDMESSDTAESVPDDFINAIKLQTSYLEEEIEDWLIQDGKST